MLNTLKKLAPQSKEDVPIVAAFGCLLVGLVIQVIVIVCSFSWAEKQFGLPNVATVVFVQGTLLTLIPILGFIAFANFALLFLSTFNGPNVFGHPWFYHLLGMAIFDIGMILFMRAAGSATSPTKAGPPAKDQPEAS